MLNALGGELIKIGQVLEIRSPNQASKAVSLRKISYKVRRGGLSLQYCEKLCTIHC